MADTKSMAWFKDNVSENQDELIKIANMGIQRLHEVLSLGLDDPIIALSVYAHIFESMCKVLAKKENDYDEYNLNVAEAFHLGYNTTDSEDDEKSGNFMVYMNHIPNDQLDAVIDDEETDTLALCALWNAMHIKTQAEEVKEVAIQAMKDLGEHINIKVQSHEFIIPMFCILHSQFIRFLKQQRSELKLSEYELNDVLGLFTIGCAVNENAEEEIYYVPSIALKLLFKNDSIASSSGDDD